MSSFRTVDVPPPVQPIVFSHDDVDEAPDYSRLADARSGEAARARRSPFAVSGRQASSR
jgi:hypothetical protein